MDKTIIMDEKHLNRLYEIHKNDSNDSLNKIANNPNKYSKESVYIANKLLNERVGEIKQNEENETSNAELLLKSINKNIFIIRNIIILYFVISLIFIFIKLI